MKRSLELLAVLLVLTLLTAQAAEVPYRFPNPVVLLGKAGTTGKGEMMVEGPPGKVTFDDEGDHTNYAWTKADPTGDANGKWRLSLSVANVPTPLKQTRFLKIAPEGKPSQRLPYTLVDQEPAAGTVIKWTALSDGSIGTHDCLRLSGTASALPATGVRLVSGRVRENRSLETMPYQALDFGAAGVRGKRPEGYEIPARSTTLFYVCTSLWPLGELTADLSIASLQEAAPQAVQIKFRTRSTLNGTAAGPAAEGFYTDNPVAFVGPVTDSPAVGDPRISYGELIVFGPDHDVDFFDSGDPAVAASQPLPASFEKTTGGRKWKVGLKFARVSDNAVQRRVLTVSAEKVPLANLEYWLVNSAVTPALTVQHSTDQATLGARDCLVFALGADRFPLTGVQLGGGSLVEAKSGATVTAEHMILRSLGNQRINSIDLPPRSTAQVQVCLPEGSEWAAGAVSGKLRFGSAQKFFTDDVSVAFNTRNRVGTGVALLIVGTSLCLVLRFVGDAMVARAQAMVPVVELRNQLNDLASRLEPLEGEMPETRKGLAKEIEALTYAKLAPHPPSPVPWGIKGMDDLQAYLKLRSDRMTVLSILIRGGWMISKRAEVAPRPPQDAVAKAFVAVDGLALLDAPQLDDLRTKIQQAMDDLEKSVPRAEGEIARAETVEPVTFRTLDLQVRRWVFARLIIGAILIVLAGSVTLIFSQKSFGTAYDLSLCALWGFGLSTLSNIITRDQVLSSVGLQVPQK